MRALRLRAAWLVGCLALAACGLARPVPLDMSPEYRVVLGRVDITTFEVWEGVVDIERDDHTFTYQLPFGRNAYDFAIGLPRGRYRVMRIRGIKDSWSHPNDTVWDVKLGFDVGDEPAIYIGTLRFQSDFKQLRVSVEDELDRTLALLRTRYSNLPDSVVRALATRT